MRTETWTWHILIIIFTVFTPWRYNLTINTSVVLTILKITILALAVWFPIIVIHFIKSNIVYAHPILIRCTSPLKYDSIWSFNCFHNYCLGVYQLICCNEVKNHYSIPIYSKSTCFNACFFTSSMLKAKQVLSCCQSLYFSVILIFCCVHLDNLSISP